MTYGGDRIRTAIEAGDYVAALAALSEYWAAFHSQRRTPEEIAEARDLLIWSKQAIQNGRERMAGELAFLAAAVDE
jgi:hypothetical protein